MEGAYNTAQILMTPPKKKFPLSCVLLIGVVVAAIIAMIMSKIDACKPRMIPVMVSSMKAALLGDKKDAHLKTNLDSVTNLTPCADDDEKCNDFQKVDPSQKALHTSKVVEFDQEHADEKCMYMIYAPWCPHCHTAMPNFVKASNDVDIPFAMINAELVDSSILQGDKMFNITHFPYIVMKTPQGQNVFKGAPEVEELVKFAK